MILNNNRGLRTWLEINKEKLASNYQVLRGLLQPQTKLLGVVKSNAYGHGLVEYALELERLGANFIGVDSVLEGFALREAGLKAPILVLGYTLPSNTAEAVKAQISLTVSSWEWLQEMALEGVKGLRLHLKFDTGMCRQGFFPEEAEKVLNWLKNKENDIIIEGVYTHFASAKNPAFPAGTKAQMDKFEAVLAEFENFGLKPIRHASATSGAIVFPEAHYDMVRFGIGLMGLWPSKEVEYAYSDKLNLQPILTWKTIVSEVKVVPAGSRVGYDGTELLERETKIAILPVGYWHGYARSLSSLGRVVINGHRARVLGRVSMDMIVVDITDLSVMSEAEGRPVLSGVEVGDEAILIGADNKAEFSADEMADLAGSSNYEIVTRLNPLIKRVYIN